VMEDEGAERLVHLGPAHEDLRPVRAAEVKELPRAQRDRPAVLPPVRMTLGHVPALSVDDLGFPAEGMFISLY